MKVIPLSKAKARLSYYSRLCQREPVIVTVKGLPSFQMVPLQEDDDLIAGLNLYARKPAAFDGEAETVGLVLATHGALALTSAARWERIEHLERALGVGGKWDSGA